MLIFKINKTKITWLYSVTHVHKYIVAVIFRLRGCLIDDNVGEKR